MTLRLTEILGYEPTMRTFIRKLKLLNQYSNKITITKNLLYDCIMKILCKLFLKGILIIWFLK